VKEIRTMLRLNVGVSRKVGLPDYGSAGASCNIEVELSSDLLLRDPDGFREQVRNAYAAAHQAVNDELSRLQGRSAPVTGDRPAPVNGHSHRDGGLDAPASTHGPGNGGRARPGKAATANQVRAIVAIARRHRADLEDLLRDGYGVGRPEDLSLADASTLIDRLNATAAV
jgi:hypothetical protein